MRKKILLLVVLLLVIYQPIHAVSLSRKQDLGNIERQYQTGRYKEALLNLSAMRGQANPGTQAKIDYYQGLILIELGYDGVAYLYLNRAIRSHALVNPTFLLKAIQLGSSIAEKYGFLEAFGKMLASRVTASELNTSTARYAASAYWVLNGDDKLAYDSLKKINVIDKRTLKGCLRQKIKPFNGKPIIKMKRITSPCTHIFLDHSKWHTTNDINANSTNGTQVTLLTSQLVFLLTSGIQLTPFHGKLSTFSHWIAYVEPYLSLGAGLARTDTDNLLTYYPGIGLRVFFKEWFSMRFEIRDYMYTGPISPLSTQTELQQNVAMLVSLSFWLPKMAY